MVKQKICIIGNGLTGLTAALILGKLNLEVHLIAAPDTIRKKDIRTTAISESNYKGLINFIGKKNSKIFFESKEIDLYKEHSKEIKHFMNLSNNKYLYYSNSTMVSGNMIGHSGYGGQFLAVNLKTGNVAAFFSVLETKSATKESYKVDMINMLIDLVDTKY